MSTIRKKRIFEAMKFGTLKSTKFYSSEIKRVYRIIIINKSFFTLVYNNRLTVIFWTKGQALRASMKSNILLKLLWNQVKCSIAY